MTPRSQFLKENAIHIGLMAASTMSILIVFLIFFFLIREAIPFIFEEGLGGLIGTRWNPVSFENQSFGILPLITGSLLVTLLAGAIAMPLGVCIAVYIAELAQPVEREILKPVVEILAGLPSVVLGFFGLVVLAPFVKEVFNLPTGLTALTGALVLALMAIPTVISISEDAIRSVPTSYKDASLALGAGTQQTIWRVVVPAAFPGITAAVMLGFGRVIGETMAVMMVTGNAALLTFSPVKSVRTMTATIAAEMGEVSFGGIHYHALFCVGVVLLLATFTLNVVAIRAMRRVYNR